MTETNNTTYSITPKDFPDAPKNERVWVCWRHEPPPGSDVVTKMPKRADGKGNAKTNDPGTWSPYEVALQTFEARPDHFAGIGMVFQEDDPYVGVDLDGCRDPETGVITPWARGIVEALDTYTEVSPSETGLKMWTRGHIPHQAYAKKFKDGERPGIEVYPQGRWFAVTGWRLEGTPEVINARTSALTRLVKKHFPDRFTTPDGPAPRPVADNSRMPGGEFDLETWLRDHNVPVAGEAADSSGRKWKLKACPRSDRHSTPDSTGAYVVQMPAADGGPYGGISGWCSHAGCGGGSSDIWHDLRRAYEPGWEPYKKITNGGRKRGEGGALGDQDGDVFYLPPELELTDLGNSSRFARRYGGQLIYSPAIGGYGEYRAGRYVRDDLGKRFELAKAVPKEFMAEAGNISATDQDAAKKYAKHGIASAARPRLESMVALAHSDPRIAVPSEDLDGDPYLFNCASGTIDLRTGKQRPHDQGDRLTKISAVEYHAGAACPTWLRFLEEILPEEELRTFLRRWFGWCLTGIVNQEILPIFYGTGANGKSTLVNILLEILGDYGQQAPQDLLMVKRREHPTELADLFGRRLVASAESEEGVRLNESLVKQLTGRERVRARYMRQDFFEFDPTHKLVLLTNHKPNIRGSDKGIWRRLKVVPFEVTIPEAEQDKGLDDKLREELPGILAWAVKGCLEWQSEGLSEPQKIRVATADYREEQDVIGAFFDECCSIVEDEATYTRWSVLFETYQEWCKRSGENVMKKRDFSDRLKERGFPPDNGPKNVAIRRRILLREDAPRPDRGGGERLFNASSNTQNINPNGRRVNEVNPENTCKSQESGEKVNVGYPNSDISGQWKPSRGGDSETTLTQVNPLTHEADKYAKYTDGSTHTKRRLSEEEARQVQKLIGEGMGPEWARAAVVGADE